MKYTPPVPQIVIPGLTPDRGPGQALIQGQARHDAQADFLDACALALTPAEIADA